MAAAAATAATVAATLLAAPVASAQHMAGTLIPDASRGATIRVQADSALLTVSRGKDASVRVRMPAGTFSVRTDTVTLARWVEFAAALPPIAPPTMFGDPTPVPGALLRGATGAAAMRLARLPAREVGDTVGRWRLETTNGAWGGVTVIGAPALRALVDAVHGRDTAGTVAVVDSVFFEFQVDRPASVTRAARPAYPEALKDAHMEGTVQMEYEVAPDGHMRPESVLLLKTSAPEFARAVRDALPTMQFQPAVKGGVPITMVVQQLFEFRF